MESSFFEKVAALWTRLAGALIFCLGAAASAHSTILQAPSLPVQPQLPAESQVCGRYVAHYTSTYGLPDAAADMHPDTVRLQRALDACGYGKALELVGGPDGADAIVTGPLELPSGVTLWIRRGVTLYASLDPRAYNWVAGQDTCGVLNRRDGGCRALITAHDTVRSGIVGGGVIDGRGGSNLRGYAGVSWWDMARTAKRLGLHQNNPRLLEVRGGRHFTLYGITLENSPEFHVAMNGVDGFLAWGIRIETPTKAYPRYDAHDTWNTDGIDPAGSRNVFIIHSYISTGDDQVAIKAGSKPSRHVVLAYDHLYSGHGLSVGSETESGVADVTAYDVSIDGAENGLRIKSNASRGGTVADIRYENVCIRKTRHPLVFNPFYGRGHASSIPVFRDISLRDVMVLDSGGWMLRGYDARHPLGIRFDDLIADPPPKSLQAVNVRITLGPGGTNVPLRFPRQANVSISGETRHAQAFSCAGAFPPFPAAGVGVR